MALCLLGRLLFCPLTLTWDYEYRFNVNLAMLFVPIEELKVNLSIS